MSGFAEFSHSTRRKGVWRWCRPSSGRVAGVLTATAAGLLLAVSATVPAFAQLSETESLINRLIRLEREVQTLNLQVYRGDPAPSRNTGNAGRLPEGYAAQFEIRLSQIERQLREMTGRVEESQFQMRQLTERLDRAMTDIEYRLTLLEGGEPLEPGTGAPVGAQIQPDAQQGAAPSVPAAALATTTIAPPAGLIPPRKSGSFGTLVVAPDVPDAPAAAQAMAVAPAVALPPGDVTTQYDYAYGLLAQGDYDRAEMALTLFSETHPEHPLNSNARYWLGETYYARGQYDDAAISFAQGYQSFPEGAKAIDSLLKLGMALAAAGNRDDACLTLNQLEVEFPNAPNGIKRRAVQERNRLQCL